MKKLALCRQRDRAIHQVLLSTRFGFSMFATLATLCDDSGVSEPEYCYSSRVIEANYLLRKSEDDSGTGLHVLDLIERGSLKPDRYLYNQLLRRCASAVKLREARIVHAHILTSPFAGDLVIRNTVVDVFVRCGSLSDAREAFDEMPVKDVVTWTMLISGYSRHDQPEEALALLPQMLQHGVEPNQFALSALIKASGGGPIGKELHAYCLRRGYDSDVHVGTALIADLSRRSEAGPALGLYRRMLGEGMRPTPSTFSGLCAAVAGAGSLEQGRWAHAHAIKLGCDGGGGLVGKSLLDMYARSGSIGDAKKAFDRLRTQDLGSWNSLLEGYARLGLGKEAGAKFKDMLRLGVRPDGETFLRLLTACTGSGLVAQGQSYFESMKRKYNIEPGIPHYVAMVDLLGREGLVARAERFIREMPVEPTAAVWGAMFRACQAHGMAEPAARAAERVFTLDPTDRGPHKLLHDLYAATGRWDEASRVREAMEDGPARCSCWVEIEKSVYVFVASREPPPGTEEIREMLEAICGRVEKSGYVPEAVRVHLFVDRQGKETDLQGRAEKLASAFALLNSPPGSTVEVKKNS